ncbi:hypothetical protein [Streptomyces sp. NBC_01443]|uniref:hypothetical protein n=1 Tax=Streptomyces sp. NBC_01443 TaxID=2903868 RepID=UPI00224CA501|nr:hypothetical protein [Streptomyces sp. NBC_01443]MCX4632830.1 hypothetical protein [Streptomyces sp. NBC_01443]
MAPLWERVARPPLPKYEQRGRPRKPDPRPASPPGGWLQPALFEVCRDFTRIDPDQHADPDNPWLAWARHTAHRLGEARGWPRRIRLDVDRALIILMSQHVGGDVVRYSELHPALQPRRLNMELTIEVLDHIGVFLDDRAPSFEQWPERKLAGIAPGIRRDVEHWARLLHDGGPRSQPRDENTVWNYLNRIRPVLMDWSSGYDHLREVTRDDVLAQLDALHGGQRQHTLIVLRSLFRQAKKNGTIFKNPTSRIRVGQREYGILQPLEPEHINTSVAAVTKPADRLVLALAAVHAARSGAIRRFQLDDLDIGNHKLTIDGRIRRLDDLTLHVALECLEFRRRRWPDTANSHLLINKITALGTGPVSGVTLSEPFRGQAATLEQLRVDRQLEEALVHGPDPLHLAEVFGLDEKTAIRYANSARALLDQAAEQQLR